MKKCPDNFWFDSRISSTTMNQSLLSLSLKIFLDMSSISYSADLPRFNSDFTWNSMCPLSIKSSFCCGDMTVAYKCSTDFHFLKVFFLNENNLTMTKGKQAWFYYKILLAFCSFFSTEEIFTKIEGFYLLLA